MYLKAIGNTDCLIKEKKGINEMKKYRNIILAMVIAASSLSAAPVLAEEADTKTEISGDEFDLSEEQGKVAELGIPTISSVAELKKEADDLYAAKDYKNAATAYAVYAKNANWLANIISGTLEPYYGASYDDRKNWYPKKMEYSSLSSAESTANGYKSERNRAMLYEGLCYYYENDYETAIPLLLKALDLIEIDDETN